MTSSASDRYGRLTVLSTERRGSPGRLWASCRCDCGTVKDVRVDQLKSGNTKSCGCLKREQDILNGQNVGRLTTHGDAMLGRATPYQNWQAMKQRCLNPTAHAYDRYGGRGITICNEWLDYVEFREWAYANGYADGMTLDRTDSDGNYEPANCEWVSRSENTRRMQASK